jgi:hypothetical protein
MTETLYVFILVYDWTRGDAEGKHGGGIGGMLVEDMASMGNPGAAIVVSLTFLPSSIRPSRDTSNLWAEIGGFDLFARSVLEMRDLGQADPWRPACSRHLVGQKPLRFRLDSGANWFLSSPLDV